MTDVELEVTDSFERIFPVPVVSADWDDVLDRAGAGHRHRTGPFPRWRVVAVAAAILVGALIVTPEFGIGGRLLDLIESAPAQPEIQTPVWSPGGRKVVFSSRRTGNWDLYVVNTDGRGQRNLTHNPAFDGLPAWSPDGRKIAFVRHREGGDAVYVMNADGSDQRMLARRGNSPAWSPDGRKIAFVGGRPEVYLMNADGSSTRG